LHSFAEAMRTCHAPKTRQGYRRSFLLPVIQAYISACTCRAIAFRSSLATRAVCPHLARGLQQSQLCPSPPHTGLAMPRKSKYTIVVDNLSSITRSSDISAFLPDTMDHIVVQQRNVASVLCARLATAGQSVSDAEGARCDCCADACAEKEMEYAGPVIQVERDAKCVHVECCASPAVRLHICADGLVNTVSRDLPMPSTMCPRSSGTSALPQCRGKSLRWG